MTNIVPDQLSSVLHETNLRLGSILDSLRASSPAVQNEVRAVTPQEMATLLAELMKAGQCLRARPSQADRALETELKEYRSLVERLRGLLPSIQAALLRERARLERERDRVCSASEWAQGSRQTL